MLPGPKAVAGFNRQDVHLARMHWKTASAGQSERAPKRHRRVYQGEFFEFLHGFRANQINIAGPHIINREILGERRWYRSPLQLD